jgi:acyl-[acyl-carrier-protein]-phospholipid O-acyltransferase/long-chain-fatty-acid--[acyl-carrier-protein] ligase
MVARVALHRPKRYTLMFYRLYRSNDLWHLIYMNSSSRTQKKGLIPVGIGFFLLLATFWLFSQTAFLPRWCHPWQYAPLNLEVVERYCLPLLLITGFLAMPTPLGHSIREKSFRMIAGILARAIYRIRRFGLENLPEGGFLLLPNHMSYVDAVVLQLACPRPIRFVMHESIYQVKWLNPIFKLVQAIPISNIRAKDAIREAANRIKAGEIVCIFPEGELSRTGVLIKLRKGFELVARLAEAPVVPVWLDGLWGSIFSFERGRYFFKWPRRVPQHITIAFGKPIEPRVIDITVARQELLELGEFCFEQRREIKRHLGRVTIRGLKKKQFEVGVIDGMDGRQVKRGDLLAASIALSRSIKRNIPDERVAVVLPPGAGAVVANIAVTLANKTPVNLNFTAGRASLESAIRNGQISHAISAKPVMKRLTDFPWPANVYRLEELMPELKPRIVLWRIASLITPSGLLGSILGLPRIGDQREAVLLFTSGSSGEPKGVILTHRSILGNIAQFSAYLNQTKSDAIMASLPFFHCFGCTVTLWYPITEGVRMVTYPSPVDVVKNAELVEKHQITLLITTPTFLRSYLRRTDPKQFKSLKILIVGAEKLPRELAETFEARFGMPVHEGYGLTETAPVVSVNLPDPLPSHPGDTIQPAARPGSVGKLLPGQAARIRDPETGSQLPSTELGMLWLKGPNIFHGYLNQPERTAEVLEDGWFRTGDLARVDEDGFLHIEGRLSRFSKIGGEMVPHETLEATIAKQFNFESEEERVVVVVGVPDETKGEALVLLTTRDLTTEVLREKLLAAGLPSLWIPKRIKRVEQIPILASGKLDLGRSVELALAD